MLGCVSANVPTECMAGTRQVSGCAVLGAGVWLHVYRETLLYGVLLRDNPTDPRLTHPRLTHACDNPTDPLLVLDDMALILIVIGSVVVTVSFLGCWGACTESVCFLAFVSSLPASTAFHQSCMY